VNTRLVVGLLGISSVFAACIVTPDMTGPIAVGPGQQGGAPMSSGGPIEAGCSYNATQLPPAPEGTSFQVACPPGCQATGGLWGTDVYTGDSAICRAAVHAGIIPDAGGYVGVLLDVGQPAYRGSVRNGVRSSDYGPYRSSFRLQRP
jgi:hypothetical protein